MQCKDGHVMLWSPSPTPPASTQISLKRCPTYTNMLRAAVVLNRLSVWCSQLHTVTRTVIHTVKVQHDVIKTKKHDEQSRTQPLSRGLGIKSESTEKRTNRKGWHQQRCNRKWLRSTEQKGSFVYMAWVSLVPEPKCWTNCEKLKSSAAARCSS